MIRLKTDANTHPSCVPSHSPGSIDLS